MILSAHEVYTDIQPQTTAYVECKLLHEIWCNIIVAQSSEKVEYKGVLRDPSSVSRFKVW